MSVNNSVVMDANPINSSSMDCTDSKKALTGGSGGSAALEQFLMLGKSCKGLAAVHLIRQVLESPQIYVFGEFLDLANIKELASNPEYSSYYDLLSVFAFGTYKDYLL